jgi:hypothetical protein
MPKQQYQINPTTTTQSPLLQYHHHKKTTLLPQECSHQQYQCNNTPEMTLQPHCNVQHCSICHYNVTTTMLLQTHYYIATAKQPPQHEDTKTIP